MKTYGKKSRLSQGSGRCGALPGADAIGAWSRALPLFGAVACFAAMPMAADAGTLGTGSCGTATINGNAEEWNLAADSWDFYAPMYRLGANGISTTDVVANLYLRWKNNVAYVLVRATPGNTVETQDTLAWVKDYVGAQALLQWIQGPQWVYEGGQPVGYEASFALPAAGIASGEINVGVPSGGAYPDYASTGSLGGQKTIALIPPSCAVGIGDRLYIEQNGIPGYQYDEDEVPPVGGIEVDLIDSGTKAKVGQTSTDAQGCYLFNNLPEGSYFVRLPASLFQAGGKLRGFLLAPDGGSDVQTLDDDVDHNARADGTGNIVSAVYDLSPFAEPTSQPGGTEVPATAPGACPRAAHEVDPSVNRTADLALTQGRVGIGNLVWKERGGDTKPGVYDPNLGTPTFDTPVKNLTIHLDRVTYDENNVATITEDVQTTQTDLNGFYLFDDLIPGYFRVRIAKEAFHEGGPLYKSAAAIGESSNDQDDNVNHNALDVGVPANDGVTTAVFSVWPGEAPAATGQVKAYGPGEEPLEDASSVDLTRDLAFGPGEGGPLSSLGSTVWVDANGNGVQDPDEPGLPGIKVTLWKTGSGGAPEQVGEVKTTDANGNYLFSGLESRQDYVVKIAASEMANDGGVAKALRNYYVAHGVPAAANIPVKALSTQAFALKIGDLKVDGDNNGSQSTGRGGEAATPQVTVTQFYEPVDGAGDGWESAQTVTSTGYEQDQLLNQNPAEQQPWNAQDFAGDMTVDLGFEHQCPLACDVNGNGAIDKAGTPWKTTDCIMSAGKLDVTAMINAQRPDTQIIRCMNWYRVKPIGTAANGAGSGDCDGNGTVSGNDAAWCEDFMQFQP